MISDAAQELIAQMERVWESISGDPGPTLIFSSPKRNIRRVRSWRGRRFVTYHCFVDEVRRLLRETPRG